MYESNLRIQRCQEVNHLWGGNTFEEEVTRPHRGKVRESTGKYIPTHDYQRYAYSVSRATSPHLLMPLWLLNSPNLSEFGLLMYSAAMSTVASFIVIHAIWT